MAAELTTKAHVHEIVLQFQALFLPPPPPHWMATYRDVALRAPQNVYMTFQLPLLSSHTTATAALRSLSSTADQSDEHAPRVLYDQQTAGITVHVMTLVHISHKHTHALQARFTFDPSTAGDLVQFVQALHVTRVDIDVWDGDTLLLLGTASLPLSHLLRGAALAVQTSLQLPVLMCQPAIGDGVDEVTYHDNTHAPRDFPQSQPGESPQQLLGALYVAIANIGHVKAVPWAAASLDPPRIVIPPNLTAKTAGRSTTVLGRRMVEQDVRLAARLMEHQSNDDDADASRRLSKFARVRARQGVHKVSAITSLPPAVTIISDNCPQQR